MNKWVRRSVSASALTAGALLAGGAAAHASPTMISTDNVGALSGTQAVVPVQAPINLCGVAAAVGGAAAECDGGAAATIDQWAFANSGPSMVSSGNVGIGNGTQLYAPIQAPVNVCGVAVGVLGSGEAGCDGGAKAEHGEEPEDDNGYYKPHQEQSEKNHQKDEDNGRYGPGEEEQGGGGDGVSMVSAGNVGVLNGTQVVAPVQVPINICGVAVGVLGSAQAACDGGAIADLTL